ncbi:MAG: glycosyltransferase [Actinobacteria bacterium]|nr:glycosyltransferase [Actinomycetota bacterium]
MSEQNRLSEDGLAGAPPAALAAAQKNRAHATGWVRPYAMRWLYGACAGVVSASHEDYGLTPLEAASFAKPVAFLRGGGFLDTVVEDETGVFFDEPVPADIASGLRRLLAETWSVDRLRAHARPLRRRHLSTTSSRGGR